MTISLQNFGNVPSNLIQNATYTIGILNEIFNAYPGAFRFTSGYRTPGENAAAGGVSNSYHLKALAGDFVPLNGNAAQYENGIKSILNKYSYELLYHNAGSGLHFHIEPSPQWRGINENSPSGIGSANYLTIGLVAVLCYLIISD